MELIINESDLHPINNFCKMINNLLQNAPYIHIICEDDDEIFVESVINKYMDNHDNNFNFVTLGQGAKKYPNKEIALCLNNEYFKLIAKGIIPNFPYI